MFLSFNKSSILLKSINSDNKNNFYLVFVNKSKPTGIFKNNYLVTKQLKNVNSM